MNWLDDETAPARICVRPVDAVSLDSAYEAIELWQYYRGRTLDPAQRQAVEMMMATNSVGNWAARTTGREVARQSGKGDEIEVVELYGLTQRGEAIGHTAHEIPTVSQAFERMLSLFGHRDLRRKVTKELAGKGQQEIRLSNGAVIWYRTRTSGGLRGLDDLSRVVLDEAQYVESEQLASATPTLSVNPNPQVNAIGTGAIRSKADGGAWWWDQRIRALSPNPGAFAYLGHTAEDVTVNGDGDVEQGYVDPTDESLWWASNPALHAGRKSIEEMREELRRHGPEKFAREHLCVWDPPQRLLAMRAKIDPHWWRACRTSGAIGGQVVVALATTFDLDNSALVVCGREETGRRRVEVVQHDGGSHWLEIALLDVLDAQRVAKVALDASGPSKALRPMLERVIAEHNDRSGNEVELAVLSMGKYQASCAAFVADVKAAEVTHDGDSRLTNLAVSVPARKMGDGWMWDGRVGDITPLTAATCAVAVADSLPELQTTAPSKVMRTRSSGRTSR